MTLAKLVATAAGTKRVVCLLSIAISDDAHHFRRRAALLQQLGHHRHRRTRVHEEQLKTLAEIVVSGLAVARNAKTVLGATTVAKIPNLAVLALLRERIAFVIAKLALLRRRHHLQKRALVNVAEQVFRLNKMVAGVKIAVVFQRRTISTGRGVDAQQVPAEKGLECHIEQLHKNFAHVMPNPLFEDVHEELPILPATNSSVGHQVARLRIEDALAIGLLAPAQICDLDRVCAGSLDNGDELHPLCAHLVAKEAIDRAAVFLVGSVHRTQDIEVHIVLAQVAPALHYLVEGSLLPAIKPIGIVDLPGTVATKANKKIVFLEKRAPLVIKEDAVRLERVLDGLPGPAIFLDEFNGTPEELNLHQRGFAALPCDSHRRRTMRFEELFDVELERLVRHPMLLIRIQGIFGKEEAIGAIDVAGRTARFCQQVKARWCILRRSSISHQIHVSIFSAMPNEIGCQFEIWSLRFAVPDRDPFVLQGSYSVRSSLGTVKCDRGKAGLRI